MNSVRRAMLVFAGLMVAYGLFSVAAQGLAPELGPVGTPNQGSMIDVELEKTDSSVITGRFTQAFIPVQSEYGELRVDPNKVRTIEVTPPEDPSIVPAYPLCALKMTDKNTVHGQWAALEFSMVTTDGKTVSVPLSEVERIKFLHPKTGGLIAALVGLLTLTFLEIVLGVDNVIFIAILAAKVPEAQRPKARRIGLFAALGTRLILLFTLTYLMGLTKALFILPDLPMFETMEQRGISLRDLILLLGGAFLVGKSTSEMHAKVQDAGKEEPSDSAKSSFVKVIVMIALVDIVFSLDSVITAVGIVEELWVMVAAMVAAMGVMLVAAEPISRFVDKHPTVKVLALSFLILIGVLLVAEGFGQHVNKGYIYFAMVFAVVVEIINMQLRKGKPDAVVVVVPDKVGKLVNPQKEPLTK